MKWKKLGWVYGPDSDYPWMTTHANNTVAEHISDDLFRIYFSCRDIDNHSSIGYVDVDISPPFRILGNSPKPVLVRGETGTV